MRRERWSGWAALPAALALLLFFGGGLVEAVVVSLEDRGSAWTRVLGSRELRASLALTWRISVSATVAASALGLGLALGLRKAAQSRAGRFGNIVLQLPLAVPHLLVAIALLRLLSQSGLLARVALALGLRPSMLPSLVNDDWGLGIALAYVWKEGPFVAVLVLASLRGETLQLEAVARNLGASPWRVLRDVTLPAALPSVGMGALLAFAYTFGAFEVPRLLGQTYPSMLGVWSWRRYTDSDFTGRPEAMVLSVLIFGSVAGAALLAGLLGRLTRGAR